MSEQSGDAEIPAPLMVKPQEGFELPDSIVARFRAREIVTFTGSLSPGARLLYLALDEYARDNGVCWPRQKTLAARLGISIRQLKRSLAELRKAEICAVERASAGGHNRYRLLHSDLGTWVAPPGDMGVPTLGTWASPLLNRELNQQTPPTPSGGKPESCEQCAGKGWVLTQIVTRGTGSNIRVPCTCVEPLCGECRGKGTAGGRRKCRACGGSGRIAA